MGLRDFLGTVNYMAIGNEKGCPEANPSVASRRVQSVLQNRKTADGKITF